MNGTQKKVLWVVIAIICLMALFPIRASNDGVRARGFLYHEKITIHRNQCSFSYSAGVDLATLIAQMLPVLAVGAGLIVSLHGKNGKSTAFS
jgi:hypothetical protein